MIRSMTGFGRGSIEVGGRSYIIEIKTVNHRYCDISIKMPKNLIPLEDKIRKLIQEKVYRGKVDVFITQNSYVKQDAAAVFNENLADSYVDCLKKIKERYNLNNDISISLISKFPEVITLKQGEDDLDEIWDILSIPINQALNVLIKMREKEGRKLQENIELKCNSIKTLLHEVEEVAPVVVLDYKSKLEERLKQLLCDTPIDESRIAMEVALFADKACIDEEIVRLNSHIIQLMETLTGKESVGRKLDFIVQEMNRETNTIGSKANDLKIVNIVLNIKNEIEKIREQIQNVE